MAVRLDPGVVMRLAKTRLALMLVLALAAAACSNSESDGGDSGATDATEPVDTADETVDTGDEPSETEAPTPGSTGAPQTTSDEPASTDGEERDTFVSLSGVPGVTDDEIVFDVIGTRSNNPLGTYILDCYVAGIQAYFDYRNDEGGIYGRELVIGNVRDDELSQNQVQAIEVISEDQAFGVFNATLVASGFGDLDDAGVPTFVWNIHPAEFAGRPSLFGHLGAICDDCPQRSLAYFVQETGATKVAALGYGVSEQSKVCAQSLRDTIGMFSDAIGGAEVVYFNDELAFGLPNGVGPEVTAMREAGVEFIGSCLDLNGMKTLGEELQRQGMDDVVMQHPNSYQHSFVASAGGIFEGDFVTPQFLPFESDTGNELQVVFEEYLDDQGAEPTELAMTGFINADQAFTGLLEAGPELSRQKVIDGLNSLTAHSAGGLIVPIDWTRQHDAASRDAPGARLVCTAGVRIVDGSFETVADPETPWLCWDNEETEWTQPEQLAFGDD